MNNKHLSPRQLKAQQAEEWREKIAELYASGVITKKTYIKYNEAKDAYEFVLDTGEKAIPALKYVADKHNLPPEWVDKVRNNPLHKQSVDKLLKASAKHPVVTSMKSNDVLTTGSKRAIKESKTINSLLNTVSDLVNLNKRVTSLEDRVDFLEAAVYAVAQETINNKLEIESVKLDVKDLNKAQQKQLARDMKGKGLTYEEIGVELGKNRQTISNWLKGK